MLASPTAPTPPADPVDGSDFELPAGMVIGPPAEHQHPVLNDLPVRLNNWGDIEVDGSTMTASEAKIFAGGDCVTGPATVIEAVAAGRRAAWAMDQFVTKGYVRGEPAAYNCSRGSLEDLPRDEFESRPKLVRHPMPAAPVADRLAGFGQVETGYTEADARAEAARCLRCGCKARFVCDLRKVATRQSVAYTEPLHLRPRIPIVRDHPFIIRDHSSASADAASQPR